MGQIKGGWKTVADLLAQDRANLDMYTSRLHRIAETLSREMPCPQCGQKQSQWAAARFDTEVLPLPTGFVGPFSCICCGRRLCVAAKRGNHYDWCWTLDTQGVTP